MIEGKKTEDDDYTGQNTTYKSCYVSSIEPQFSDLIMEDKCDKLVIILLCTFNGQKYLAEQLRSIECQAYRCWRIILSDDGSNDNTLEVVSEFQSRWGVEKLEVRKGPRSGFCQNFLTLACDKEIVGDYYAFCDQDDVWMQDKLLNAVTYFESFGDKAIPNAYCGRTKLVDEHLNEIGLSPLFTLPPSFRNSLVQSIGGGNTMVFNQSAKTLLEVAGQQKVVSHDWWLYQIIKGAGGVLYYDPIPTVFYRQHSASIIGSNQSIKAKLNRINNVLNGRFKVWTSQNVQALKNVETLLTADCQDVLQTFIRFRGARLKDRVRLLEVCGIYRQTWQGTLSLWLATIFNKI